MRKRAVSLILCLCMILALVPVPVLAQNVENDNPFSDVEESDWFYDGVQYVFEHELMKGTSSTIFETLFEPERATQRGMIVTILYRLDKSPPVTDICPFEDVPRGSNYENAIIWAASNGIVTGYNEMSFGPYDDITRQQMAAILYRYASVKHYDVAAQANLNVFTDSGRISNYARVPLSWANAKELINGITPAILAPTEKVTRAQSAVILTRFCENIIPESSTVPSPAPVTYTVTFDLNYSDAGTYQVLSVKSGEKINEPAKPNRNGYYFLGWYIAKTGGSKFDFNSAINTTTTLYARWNRKSNNNSGDSSNRNDSNTPMPTTSYTISFNLLFDDLVQNKELFHTRSVLSGESLSLSDPVPAVGYFDGWYTSLDYTTPYNLNSPIIKDVTLYAKWGVDSTDTDGDKLFDVVELYLGLDPNKTDTDGDGLSDGVELDIKTNPLLLDSDNNGVIDYDEDADGDGLTNGEEIIKGTSPIAIDTDLDGLSDYNEVTEHNTNPLHDDTDEDGGSDGWEVTNGFNPLVYDSTFTVSILAEEPSATVPVTVGVVANVDGNNFNVDITPISFSENASLSPGISGYLGTAYNFDTNGSLDNATLVFRYDASLGEIGDDFQPRIYYLDEEHRTFKELENQNVVDGQVTAQVSHFSTYVLLNKVEFDAVWNNDIRPPISQSDEPGEDATLDIVFVIDYSASMDDNDPNQLCKTLSKEFVGKLRDEKDRAAVVEFIKRANVLSELTTDKDTLNHAIDSIVYDDGFGTYSGTNGSAGLKVALELLNKSESEYKYIVFITDGEDNSRSYSYEDLADDAVSQNVIIYAVGMGTASEEVLKYISAHTGGRYYHATASVESEEVIDLDKVFMEIESETIDLTTDTNHDGISDYYTKLIFEGKLPVSNSSIQFIGQDFNYDIDGNLSDDYDGDGLKNGQELRVVQDGDTVYLEMYSDPMMKHSDADGIDDYEEFKRGSDPLRADFDGNSVGILSSTDGLYYNQIVELYEDDWVFRAEQAFFGIGMTEGFVDSAKKQIINYFHDYSSDEYLQHQTTAEEVTAATEIGNDMIEKLLKYIGKCSKYIEYVKKGSGAFESLSGAFESLSEADVLSEIKKAAHIIAEYKSAASDLYEMSVRNTEWYEKRLVESVIDLYAVHYENSIGEIMSLNNSQEFFGTAYLKLHDINNRYKNFMDKKIISEMSIEDTIELASIAADVADQIITISKVNAATKLFERNMDIIERIRDNATHKDVAKAAQEVLYAMGQGASSYYEEVAKAVTRTTAKGLVDQIKGEILKENPIYKGYTIAMGILKLTGGEKTVQAVYSILTYSDMIDAVNSLCLDGLEKKYNARAYYYFYPVDENGFNDTVRYLTHATQLCTLAERTYVNLSQTDKLHDELASENIRTRIKWASELSLPFSTTLLEELQKDHFL